ncbi:hypothetical protein SNE40_021261 [Patella caerulea]|uniref:Uncharacterized protein n=1 Tax=Patella caerulea TaxID=87958 RepID=A0AAN8GAV6_PATCE
MKVKKVQELPEEYTNIRPAYITKKSTPPVASKSLPLPELLRSHFTEEYTWLEEVYLTENVADAVNITWSAHHATQKRSRPFEVSISTMMPMWREQTHSVAMIKHAMAKVRDTTVFLNPGKIPVIIAAQPLYALAKQIQWKWPEYGEDKFVVMFGELHIEMASLRSIGTLLRDSGWTSAIVEANVASPGTSESFLSASSVTKTRQSNASNITFMGIGVRNVSKRVHSSNSGIWCWTWNSQISSLSGHLEKETSICTVKHFQNWHLTSLQTTMSTMPVGSLFTSEI